MNRPPLGVLPRFLWLELLEVPDDPSPEEMLERKKLVQEAIQRYEDAGCYVPKKWMNEVTLLTN
ncbi:hypothetical protein GCM10028805_47310 [Spirosoma harenae]